MKAERIPYLSVGIDIGADFSLMAIALPTTELSGRPYKIFHCSQRSVQGAIDRIHTMEQQYGFKAKVFMESTGIYHYPLYYRLKESGLDAFILNPLITHAGKNINVRNVHNDKFDAQKIALLGLRSDLKTSIVPEDDLATVKVLVREYHSMKKECSQYICSLTAQLRQTFPQISAAFFKSQRQDFHRDSLPLYDAGYHPCRRPRRTGRFDYQYGIQRPQGSRTKGGSNHTGSNRSGQLWAWQQW